MLEAGLPPRLVEQLRNLYSQQRAAVRTANLLSEWLQVKTGVQQECNLSPYLFNILAEQLMRRALQGFAGGFRTGEKTISNHRYPILAYKWSHHWRNYKT